MQLVELFEHHADMHPGKTFVFAVVSLIAHIDESYAEVGNYDQFAVGGTIGTLEQWKAFSLGWRPHLDRLGERYHATDHKRLAQPLAELMIESRLFSSYISVSKRAFKKAVPSVIRSVLGAEYTFGLNGVMSRFVECANNSGADGIIYYIEPGHPESDRVVLYLNMIQQNEELRKLYMMERWGVSKKEDPENHCADSVAHYCANFQANPNLVPSATFRGLLANAGLLDEKPIPPDLIASVWVPVATEIIRIEKARKAKAKWNRWRDKKEVLRRHKRRLLVFVLAALPLSILGVRFCGGYG